MLRRIAERVGRAGEATARSWTLDAKTPARSPGEITRRNCRAESPNPAGVFRHHGLAHVAAEGFAELVEVADRSVGAEHAGRVRIGFGGDAGNLLGAILTPHLPKADEVALGFGVAVDLVVDALALFGERGQQRLPGDADAAVVRGIFTEGELAIDVDAGNRLEAAVFIDLAVEALLEGGCDRRRSTTA